MPPLRSSSMKLTPCAAAEGPQRNMRPAGESRQSYWCRWMVYYQFTDNYMVPIWFTDPYIWLLKCISSFKPFYQWKWFNFFPDFFMCVSCCRNQHLFLTLFFVLLRRCRWSVRKRRPIKDGDGLGCHQLPLGHWRGSEEASGEEDLHPSAFKYRVFSILHDRRNVIVINCSTWQS